MPELPEVETVRRGLSPHLVGQRLVAVEQRRPDLRFPLPERFAARLTGARVLGLERRAKYLRAPLDTGETLVCHLGMTGRFTVEAAAQGRFAHAAGGDPKHTHVVLRTERGVTIGFNDARRFGFMELIDTEALERHPWFAGLGPEPLGPSFGPQVLARGFAGRVQSVKATLLDQRVVAGLGNIYVCEALHRAGIHPERPAGEVAGARLKRLAAEIVATLEEAVAAGGSTLRGLSFGRRRARLLPARLPGVRARGRTLPQAALPRRGAADRAGGTLDVLLPGVPAVKRKISAHPGIRRYEREEMACSAG